MIRVLVVEDSDVARDLLVHILTSDPELQVVATASDGEEALHAVDRAKPDVITMDIHMPKMDGFDAIRRIMESQPTPIVIVSGIPGITEKVKAFRAMEIGALAVLPRPAGIGHPDYELTSADLIRTVKLMSEVKVVRRWGRPRPAGGRPSLSLATGYDGPAAVAMIVIGASTGGPLSVQSIVSQLPPDFPVPVLVVQHIASGFVSGFADWLGQSSALPVRVAAHGDLALPGNIYVAPDGFHMKAGAGGRILLDREPPENGLRPSVACLFRSVAKVYGAKATGVLLSGMGKDGACELKLMRDQGSVTFAQDKETSVVHGMPGEAIRLGGAAYVLPPDQIALALMGLVARSARRKDGE